MWFQTIRRAAVRRILLRPLVGLLFLATVVSAAGPWLIPYHPEVSRVRSSILSLLILIAASVSIGTLIRGWWRERQNLYESENYLILVTIAVYFFMLLGAFNYSLYRVNRKAFIIDRTLEESLKSSAHQERVAWLDQSRRRIKVWSDLGNRISDLNVTSFEKIEAQGGKLIVLPISGASVLLTYSPPARIVPPLWAVEAQLDGERASIGSGTHVDFASAIQSLEQTSSLIPKNDLVSLFRDASEWERQRWVTPLEKAIEGESEGAQVPLSLFLYQGAMDAMGSSPNYFLPGNATTRVVALVASFIKYVFFGFFVSLLSKRWQLTQKENPHTP
jgi:hypothetical protein